MTADTGTLVDQAAAHLDAAADLALQDGTPDSGALAGLIQLTRAGLAPGPAFPAEPTIAGQTDYPNGDRVVTVTGLLRSALAALDDIDPLDASPHLLAWSWQIADLIRVLEARHGR